MFHDQVLDILLSMFALSALPAFFIFLDYHKRSNIHKAVLFVVVLFATGIAVASIPARALLFFACCVPVLLLIYVAIARR